MLLPYLPRSLVTIVAVAVVTAAAGARFIPRLVPAGYGTIAQVADAMIAAAAVVYLIGTR
jgi:hypothetical protein